MWRFRTIQYDLTHVAWLFLPEARVVLCLLSQEAMCLLECVYS